ncbi:MAG: hypothetical protein HRU20_24065 [Pseudomonadales bacterium]|nr:hypothetical protein [Pseudomonadales bacterium]
MLKNNFIKISLTALFMFAAVGVNAGHPMANEMKHESIDVPEGVAAPQLSVEVYPDMMSGFNLHIKTKNFQLEPPEFMANKPAVGVQGHAHLYVNEKKIARVYGPYVHVPASLLKDGMNMIAITINDHHHNTWRYQDKEIIAAIILNTQMENPVQSIHSPFPVTASIANR